MLEWVKDTLIISNVLCTNINILEWVKDTLIISNILSTNINMLEWVKDMNNVQVKVTKLRK